MQKSDEITAQIAKPSIIQQIKSFFGNEDKHDKNNNINDNSFSIPMSQIKAKEDFRKVNQTMPSISTKKQFSIDDDEIEYESHSPRVEVKQEKQPEKKIPQQILNTIIDGFEQIDIKQLSTPRLIEKNPQNIPYQKGHIINFPPTSTFKVSKVPNVYDSIYEYIVGSVKRDIVIDGGWLYVLKNQSKDKYKVCSCTSLNRLFKVLIKKTDVKPPIKLAFINISNDMHSMPQVKEFTIQNRNQLDLFFIKLKAEIQKHGFDFQFRQ